ncbi:MAG: sigma-70 family RNA polymerase sigma factor [Polyangiales bacterium]
MHRAQTGDRRAFRALYDRHHRRIYAVAMAMLKSPAEAQDVVQEAFIRADRHLPDFRGDASFATWLHTIGANLARDQLRRRKTARLVDYDDAVGRDENDDLGTTAALDIADPGKTQARKELAAQIRVALEGLPAYHQQVILLREVDGLSYEEIAKVMDVPKGTIMSRLFHARRKLQSALAQYVDGELKPQDESDD